MAQNLQNEYKGKKTAVISVFLEAAAESSNVADHTSFTTVFLTEVARQLRAAGRASEIDLKQFSPRSNRTAEEASSLGRKEMKDNEVWQEIVRERSFFARAFIIVDDLDIVRQCPEEYSHVEEALDQLQKSNFKILTTSRVPFNPDRLVGYCDVHGSEDKLVYGSNEPVLIWWECPICVDDGGKAEYYICDECFGKGHRCKVR